MGLLTNFLNNQIHILKKKILWLGDGEYNIGFINKDYVNSSPHWYNNVIWIDTNGFEKEGWYADPFILDVTEDKIYLLAEQLYYATNKGRIVKLTLDKSYKLQDVTPILSLDTHLSFPNIWRENGKIYVYPENYQSGKLNIWELNGNILENPKSIIDAPLLDSQIVKIEGKYFVLGVTYKTGNWSDTKEVDVWQSDSLFGLYKHIQTIQSTYNYKRGAGEIFRIDDEIMIRPTQSCEGDYGKEVILNELKYNGETFSEIEIKRISPGRYGKYRKVLHTYNVFGDLCVIDGFAYRSSLVHSILKHTIFRNKQY